MKSNIIDIEEGMPHRVFEAICISCKHRYVCVCPAITPFKKLECGGCGEVGFIIDTGQPTEES